MEDILGGVQLKMIFAATENGKKVMTMAEYIEREAAIEAVKHAWAKGLEPSQYIEIISAADVATVQEWISVDDELPGVGGYVVCIAKRNPFSRFMPMVARIEKNGWVNPITEQYISEVTHWMPMPNPPKGE